MKFFLLIFCMALFSVVKAQDLLPPVKGGLRIGDTIPDVLLKQIINDSVSSARISDFRGKLLIIDFWATNCGSCIEFLPEVNKLNGDLKDIVRILPVTSQSSKLIKSFFERSTYLKPYKIPSVVGDTILNYLFPHRFMPYDVWIGKDGKVLAFTTSANVSKESIIAVASGKPVPGATSALVTAFKNDKPLFLSDEYALHKSPDISSASVIRGEVDYEPGQFELVDTVHGIRRVTWLNMPYLNLFMSAHPNDGIGYYPTRQVIEAGEGNLIHELSVQKKLAFLLKRQFSFEAIVHDSVATATVLQGILAQIDTRLGIACRLENRLSECWVLVKKREVHFPKIKRLKQFNPQADSLNFQYASAADIAHRLNMRKGQLPVIDETGSKTHFNLKLKSWPQDIDQWNEVLAPLGFAFDAVRRNLLMLVVSPISTTKEKFTSNNQ